VEPLGVRVSADLRLEGLRGEQLRLSWSVLQRSGKTPLPAAWLKTNYGYIIEPVSDSDTVNVDFWVPRPKARGKYLISVTVIDEGNRRIAADESRVFG